MIRFIRAFMGYWLDYDSYYWFTHVHTKPEVLAEMGGDPYRNRFHYAWDHAVRWWKHRDQKRASKKPESIALPGLFGLQP